MVIVDNGGDVKDVNIKNRLKNIKHLIHKSSSNLFCGGSRKIGAEISTGEYVYFIDDDNILEPKCIKNLVMAFEKDKSLGVVGPMMLIYSRKNEVWCAGGRIASNGLLTGYMHRGQSVGDLRLKELIYGADFFPNAFMVSRKVLSIVSFNDELFPHNWTEPDFCFRVKRAGYKLATATSAIEWHDIDYFGKLTRVNERTLRDQAASRILFRRVHMNRVWVWTIFWIYVFPSSTILYLGSILAQKDSSKLLLIKEYILGTFRGMFTRIGSKA